MGVNRSSSQLPWEGRRGRAGPQSRQEASALRTKTSFPGCMALSSFSQNFHSHFSIGSWNTLRVSSW